MSENTFNGHNLGVCPTTPERDMAAFDALPPLVRARLREAPVSVAAEPLLRFWRSDIGDAVARHDAMLAGLDRKLGRRPDRMSGVQNSALGGLTSGHDVSGVLDQRLREMSRRLSDERDTENLGVRHLLAGMPIDQDGEARKISELSVVKVERHERRTVRGRLYRGSHRPLIGSVAARLHPPLQLVEGIQQRVVSPVTGDA